MENGGKVQVESIGVTRAALTDEAFAEFTYIDEVNLLGFNVLHEVIMGTSRGHVSCATPVVIGAVVSATRAAWARRSQGAACLQRSAVVTRLLRRYGVDAELVIGYKLTPALKAHAWVEVDGAVVADFHREAPSFIELDRW